MKGKGEAMKRKNKAFMGCMLSLSIILSGNCVSFAATTSPAVTKEEKIIVNEPSKVSNTKEVREATEAKLLEKAILATKKKFEIPDSMTEFNYYYSKASASDFGAGYFTLRWYDKDYINSIRVTIDLNDHITNYSSNNADDYSKGIVQYRKNELEDEAFAFVKMLDKDIASQIKLSDSYYDYNSYRYIYNRYVNNILVEGNGLSVSVNANTGKVSNYSCNWLYDISFPSTKNTIGIQDAVEQLKSNLNLQLKYFNKYEYDENGKGTIKAYLAYSPNIPYLSVDAVSKEIYSDNTSWVYTDSNAFEESEKASAADSGVGLSRAEQEKVDELSTFISKEDAIKKITGNKSLYLDENLKSIEATLRTQYDYMKKTYTYEWNIRFTDPRPIEGEDYYRAFANARVDALTGKIISYYANLPYEQISEEERCFTDEELQKKLVYFLKRQIMPYFEASREAETINDDVIIGLDDKKYENRGSQFNYIRVNEGIDYGDNYIYGSVDKITGKIYSYGFNWNEDILFESTKNIVSLEQAINTLLSEDNIKLVYEANEINHYDLSTIDYNQYVNYNEIYYVDYEMRYIFLPELNWNVSAKTGKLIDASGREKEEYISKSIVYEDIEDVKENSNILLLADMNVGFEGGFFYPDKIITQKEFITLINQLLYYYRDEPNKDLPLTKEVMASYMIDMLGFSRVASLDKIFITGYLDESKISEDYVGCVAILKALGIFEDYPIFEPNHKLTRREAVDYMVRFANYR